MPDQLSSILADAHGLRPPAAAGVVVIPRAGAAASVETVTDSEAFVALEEEWNDAVERAAIPHPFLRHEWLRTWWECFGRGARLHIVVVRAGGRIQAIAPLMRETARIYGVPVRRLRFLQNDHTPRTDLIVAERPAECCRAIWQGLLDQPEQWDLLQLGQVPRESPTLAMLSRLAADDGYASGVWHGGESPFVELGTGWDEYLATIPGKYRRNFNNRLARLTALGPPSLEVLTDPGAVVEGGSEALRLETSGWKHRAGTAITCDPDVRRFYTLLGDRASARGWLRLLFLTVGGRRIAAAYASLYRNRLSFLKTGYDPEYGKCSPFRMLTYFALRDAAIAGMREVDFLGDAEPWKLEWTRATRPHDWLFIFSRTRRARLLRPVKFQIVPALKAPFRFI